MSAVSGTQEPLLPCSQAPARGLAVSIYSPYGKTEVVETHSSGTCLTGLMHRSSSLHLDDEVSWTLRLSVWINCGLFLIQLYAFLTSGSLALLASLVDSAIDLLGQGALMWTNMLASQSSHDEYPVGRTRLEPIGVMICAMVMGMASIEVISTSVAKLAKYWHERSAPELELRLHTVVLLIGVILLKGFLLVWCLRIAKRHTFNDSMKALAQDNTNDVMTNSAALFAPMATHIGQAWWVADPFAGIAISLYIIYSWLQTGFEQVELLVGKRADPDFLRKIQTIAEDHHPKMQLDDIKAYHFGPRYLVEVEVVMPVMTTLQESHDAGIELQDKIEKMDGVERCFVHIDYQLRAHDDHDPNVPLQEKLFGGQGRSSPRVRETTLSETL